METSMAMALGSLALLRTVNVSCPGAIHRTNAIEWRRSAMKLAFVEKHKIWALHCCRLTCLCAEEACHGMRAQTQHVGVLQTNNVEEHDAICSASASHITYIHVTPVAMSLKKLMPAIS
jgi:hypothetical protein